MRYYLLNTDQIASVLQNRCDYNQIKSNHLLFMGDKRIHKIVVSKHGNQYSVIGIKHATQKKHLGLSGNNITKQAPIDKGFMVLLKGTTWQYI